MLTSAKNSNKISLALINKKCQESEFMLTERQNKTLKLIIEKYIKEPIPVGSKSISK